MYRRRAPREAEDLAQEAMVRIARGLPALRDTERIGPWAGRIARSVWVDHLRRSRPEEGEVEVAVPADLGEADATAWVAGWIPAFVDALPEPYRTAVRLADLEGMPQAALARRLELSPSGARTRVQRGRRLLRQALEACCLVRWSEGEVVDVERRCGC